jgi:hypothetical protein
VASQEAEKAEFGELLKFTGAGFVGGLLAGVVLDAVGFQRNPAGQWIVRTLSGEGESVLEGVFAFLRRAGGRAGSMAEAYGWGKFAGMVVPWLVDWASRRAGIDVYGIQGFYIPYLYSMSDQIGANVSGLIYLRKENRSWSRAALSYLTHPVMITSLAIILIAPTGLFLARLLGFSPATQTLTALETIAANLCWAPPLVGWLDERLRQKKVS